MFPPSIDNIQQLKLVSNNAVSTKNVFESFIRNIESRTLRIAFFNKFNILEAYRIPLNVKLSDREINEAFESFSKAIKVIKDKNLTYVRVVFEGIHKDKVGIWLDAFVEMANQETINDLVNIVNIETKLKIKNLKVEISNKRSFYKQRTNDELGRLEEALQTAKNLGLHEHNSSRVTLPNNNNLSIYMQDSKLYMKGTKIIEAEIKALKNRKLDDMHINGLRGLQENVFRLEAIKVDKNILQTVFVDKKAEELVEQIRPRRALIIILSFLIAGVLAIIGVFFMEFVLKLRSKVDSESYESTNNNPN